MTRSSMLDLDRAAGEGRREDHDQRTDHVIGFLRILVGDKELAGPIDEQVVQRRPQTGAVGQSQIAPDPIERRPSFHSEYCGLFRAVLLQRQDVASQDRSVLFPAAATSP